MADSTTTPFDSLFVGDAFHAPCETCRHRKDPQGGWCYMFREQPEAAKANQCGQHTGFQYGVTMLADFFRDLKKENVT